MRSKRLDAGARTGAHECRLQDAPRLGFHTMPVLGGTDAQALRDCRVKVADGDAIHSYRRDLFIINDCDDVNKSQIRMGSKAKFLPDSGDLVMKHRQVPAI